MASHVSFILVGFVSCFNRYFAYSSVLFVNASYQAFNALNPPSFSTIFLVFRNKWAYLFNNDPEVVALVARVLPLVALFQVGFDLNESKVLIPEPIVNAPLLVYV